MTEWLRCGWIADTTVNAAGAHRVQMPRGWVSLKAGNGETILAAVEGVSLNARRLAEPSLSSVSPDSFYQADWRGSFGKRWPTYQRMVQRTERGQQVVKGVITYLQKRAAMEEQCATSLRGCLGDAPPVQKAAADALSAAKGSALGWLSSATGKGTDSSSSTAAAQGKGGGAGAGPLPVEASLAREPFGSLRDTLVGVLGADSARQAEAHRAHAEALRLLAADLVQFLSRHAEEASRLLKEAGPQRVMKLDEALVRLKGAEAEYDALSSRAQVRGCAALLCVWPGWAGHRGHPSCYSTGQGAGGARSVGRSCSW
eukprot:COSAG01_NODE_3650_length_5825_cov_7.891023_4_plen_314_part_00